jgi:hypothetical protein
MRTEKLYALIDFIDESFWLHIKMRDKFKSLWKLYIDEKKLIKIILPVKFGIQKIINLWNHIINFIL